MPVRNLTPFRRRNLIRNTHWNGAAAGTPGTLPKEVAVLSDPPLAASGVTMSVVSVVSDGGMRRLGLRFVGDGTDGGSTAICLSTFANPLTRVKPGVTLTHSCYVRLFDALTGDLPTIAIQINEYDGVGAFQAVNRGDIYPTTDGIATQRQAIVARVGSPTAAQVLPIIGLYYDQTQVFDFTLGIALPQLERASRASRPQRRFI